MKKQTVILSLLSSLVFSCDTKEQPPVPNSNPNGYTNNKGYFVKFIDNKREWLDVTAVGEPNGTTSVNAPGYFIWNPDYSKVPVGTVYTQRFKLKNRKNDDLDHIVYFTKDTTFNITEGDTIIYNIY